MTTLPLAFRRNPEPSVRRVVRPEPQGLRMSSRQQVRFTSTSDGVRIAYGTTGQGAPLVKVANWLSHLELDWESPLWQHWLDGLSRNHMLIRYDGRGSGLSDWIFPPLSFEGWVNDLEAVVDAAGLKRFPLLGICRGVAVAIAYAARHPERVSHLVLHGGYARGRLKRHVDQKHRDEAEMMAKLVELGWGEDNPAGRQFFATQNMPDGTPEQHRSFNEIARLSATPQNAAQDIRQMFEIDVSGLAPRVACPTLLLHSDRDVRVPFEEGRRLAGLIPGTRLVTLNSRNHFLLPHEPAWRQWLEEVGEFLPVHPGMGQEFAELTRRERELLEHVAQGLNNAQIAARLTLSTKTVKNHLTNVFAKLGVRHRAEAIVRARDSGFGRQIQ
jgi:pimeloyl-ACP methyl ester carboxylesterase/DNA-binding CsgD family transcriptional regulator